MRVFAEVMSTPTADTPGTAVLVHFDEKRYILGQIAEGTQRWLAERKSQRAGKLSEVFLTGRTEWNTCGGLIGFLLTVGDQKKDQVPTKITVHGGDNLLHMIAATRSYVLRQQMMLSVDEQVEGKQPFKDKNVTVYPLRVRPSASSSSQLSDPQSPGVSGKRGHDESMTKEERLEYLARKVENMFWTEQQSVNVTDIEAMQRMNEVGEPPLKKSRSEFTDGAVKPSQAHSEMLPPSEPSDVAMSYLMIMHDHRGKFLPKIAKELGVTPGPAFSKLSAGETVTTAAGRVVYPSEVMTETKLGTGIAVCDLPDSSYIEDFLAKPEWKNADELQKRISCFFWILGKEVHEDPRLQEFISMFPKASHVISSPDVCPNPIRFRGAAKFTQRLNFLDPVAFPTLQSSDKPEKDAPEGTIAARPGLRRVIEPAWNWEENFDEPFDPAAALESLREIGPSFDQVVAETHQSFVTSPVRPETWPGSDVEVITLGTGSSIPSRYRNVSGTILRIPDVGTVILDCGENTVGQLRRLLPVSEYEDIIRSIKAIYISHLHADHHLGAASLIKARAQLFSPRDDTNSKFFVVAPRRFHDFLDEYSSVERIYHERNNPIYIPCECIVSNGSADHLVDANWAGYQKLMRELNMKEWRSAYALHCQDSFTTALTFNNGFKVAYSGDTRPTARFAKIGAESTLLIHEATFDDELIAEAVAKKHSTISEAVKAGRDMNAKAVCLTHFSQRYPKKPRMAASEDNQDDIHIVYAFDCMRFKVGEVGKFKRLQRGMEEVYKDVEDDAKKKDEEDEVDIEELLVPPQKKEKNRSQAKQERKQSKQERRANRVNDEQNEEEVTMDELLQSPKNRQASMKRKEMGKQEQRAMEARRARFRKAEGLPEPPPEEGKDARVD